MEVLRLEVPDRLSIFKLPPTSTAKGYQLGDWKEQVWEGGLKVFETSDDKLIVRFYSQDGKQFAMLEVPDNYEDAIVKCEDSVRGYALRLVNPKGGYTWIGLGFRDRNTAFDFRSRIADHAERKQQDSSKSKAVFQQVDDLRLNQGEKISFSINGMSNKHPTQQKPKENISNFTFSMPGQTQPSYQQVKPVVVQQSNTTSSTSGGWDDWSSFGNTQNNNSMNNNTQQKQTDFFSDFSDFSNFGASQNNNNFQSSQQQQPQQQQNNWGFDGNNFQQPPVQQNNQQQQSTQNKPTTINLLDL